MKKLITGIVAGAIVFAWGMFSWMVLPWHEATLEEFQNPSQVEVVLKRHAPESGMYMYPAWDTKPEDMKGKPHVLTVVKYRDAQKEKSMAVCMAIGLSIHILAGLILVCLLGTANVSTLKDRFKIILKTVAFAFAVGMLPNWLWWSFTTGYTLVGLADLLIGWTLAGFWIAKRA